MNALLLIIILTIDNGFAADNIASITAKNTECQVESEGTKECKIQSVKVLTLSSEQNAELHVIDDSGNELKTYNFKLVKLESNCTEPHNLFFTTDVTYDYVQNPVCYESGACNEEICSNFNHDDSTGHLPDAEQELPGMTFCVNSCAGDFLGCDFCWHGYRCSFYRIFARKAAEENYKVWECNNFAVRATIEMSVAGKNLDGLSTEKMEMTLTNGFKTKMSDLQVTLTELIFADGFVDFGDENFTYRLMEGQMGIFKDNPLPKWRKMKVKEKIIVYQNVRMAMERIKKALGCKQSATAKIDLGPTFGKRELFVLRERFEANCKGECRKLE